MGLLALALAACTDAKVELDGGSPPREDETPDDTDTDDTGGRQDTADTADSGIDTGDTGRVDTADSGDVEPVTIAVDLVSPSSGSTLGGDAVTIYGGPFTESAVVTFDGAQASVTSWTATTLAVVTPAGDSGPADIAVRTDEGEGTGTGAYTYEEPCDGVAASPSYVHTGNDDDQDVTITLTGCATGVVAVDETYTGYDGTVYGVTWTSVPASVDGTGTATLRLQHWSRLTPSSSYYPYLETDQGRVTIEVDPR